MTPRYNPIQAPHRNGWLGLLLLATAFFLAPLAPAAAKGLVLPGNALVTGFSGAPAPGLIAPGVDPADYSFIDLTGPALRVIDLQAPGLPHAQLVPAPKPYTATAAQIGQVFGVALDDQTPPNAYAAATSVYGLPMVETGADGKPRHTKTGSPGASFMPGLWWPETAGGGPGSVWKIDGVTGAISLFAHVVLDGVPNTGPALGGLAFDPDSKSLFAADRETGMIHPHARWQLLRQSPGRPGRKELHGLRTIERHHESAGRNR